MERNTHNISQITYGPNMIPAHGNENQETRFIVHWSCECCRSRPSILTKSQLIQEYGVPEARLRPIEEQIIKESKERETKQYVEELLGHLEFADISDFRCPV